ncbi:hypothetical protein [Rhodococcus qingshengii]|uniref:hypothetical protein n=1 Tax=Rhodococcus qingshengii TaxID=334542 RepID=UPI0021B0CEA6|nr:hypothetical protein [Rhodococcus qingshengii]MCT6735493.1 hypothetical protein [Rhodococcus qingshengii]
MTITVTESHTFGQRTVRVVELPALAATAIADMLDASPYRSLWEGVESDSLATAIADALIRWGHISTRWGAYEVVDINPYPGKLSGKTGQPDDSDRAQLPRPTAGRVTLTESIHFADRLVRVIELPSLTDVAVAAMLYDSPHRSIRGKIGTCGLVKRIVNNLTDHGRAEMEWGDYQLVTIQPAHEHHQGAARTFVN